MYFSFFTTVSLIASLAQCAPLQSRQLAPLYRRATPDASSDTTTTPRYIVSFHPDSVNPSNRLNWLNGVLQPSGASAKVSAKTNTEDDTTVVHDWDSSVFNGLAGSFTEQDLGLIRSQAEVAWVEEDYILKKSASPKIRQTNSPWGLARLSSATALDVPRRFDPSNTTFSYTFPSSAGTNVDIYILDSGIRTTHKDFNNRAVFLETFSDGVPGDDRDGHGTHVAGTAAGGVFGVAKNANLFAVKVLDDTGSAPTSAIISGLNLVASRVVNATANNTITETNGSGRLQNIAAALAKRAIPVVNVNNFTLIGQQPNNLNNTSPVRDDVASGPNPSVVNLSLGGTSNSRALDNAVKSLIADHGVVVVVAAGNEGVEIGNASPADVEEAITVGASDVFDRVPSFSNFGAKVDVFAPGADIISCGITSDEDDKILSGTSMATPHITGLAAVLLGEDRTLTPAQVKAKIQGLALRGALGDGFQTGTGTENRLAQNGAA
ncbi:subtilisin-like protein [Serendipita vermifera]|nr:subtilisin-like protein [Serendipita vermifera]